MTGKYAWNRQFRERIVALALDSSWYSRFGTAIIRPEFFETDAEQGVVTFLIGFYTKYNRTPWEDELLSAFEHDESALELIENAYTIDDEDLDYAHDQALQFAKEQAMKLAILDSVDDIEHGILSKPLERVAEALQVGTDLGDRGLVLKDDASWAYDVVLDAKAPTGIMHLDLMLGGGLTGGELGIIMAGTNVGKTMTLVNIGSGASSIMSKCNVAHVSAELYANEVAKRYAARTLFRWIKREDDPSEYVMEFQEAARRIMPGNVYIKEYPSETATVADIDAYLERLKLADVRIDLLIVDYPGELAQPQGKDSWQGLATIYAQLRVLAKKWDIPVWGAAQTTRSALSRPLVDVNDMGESYKAAQKADIVLALCQTKAEEEEGIARFYAAKVRTGKKGWMVRCFLDEDAHAVISEDIITVSQLMQEIKDQKEK